MKRLVVITIFTIVTGFFFIKTSGSYFSDTEASVVNSFSAASDFGITPTIIITPTNTPLPTNEPTPTQTPELAILINEVSPQGNPDREWVELYNLSGNTIDISGWTLSDEIGVITTASGTIAGHSFFVIELTKTALNNGGRSRKRVLFLVLILIPPTFSKVLRPR